MLGKWKPSYNVEACKSLSFSAFRKLLEKQEYFLNFTEEEWESEYESVTGKKTKKIEKGE